MNGTVCSQIHLCVMIHTVCFVMLHFLFISCGWERGPGIHSAEKKRACTMDTEELWCCSTSNILVSSKLSICGYTETQVSCIQGGWVLSADGRRCDKVYCCCEAKLEMALGGWQYPWQYTVLWTLVPHRYFKYLEITKEQCSVPVCW